MRVVYRQTQAFISKEWMTLNENSGKLEQTKIETHQEGVGSLASPVALSAGEACHVGVQFQKTIGLPHYSSVRVGVSLSVPCKPTEIDAVYDFARAWCNHRMTTLIDEVNLTSNQSFG